jgi:hypothetical protein
MRSYLAWVVWREHAGQFSLYLSDVREFRGWSSSSRLKDGGASRVVVEEDPWHDHPDLVIRDLVPMPRLQQQAHELVYLRLSDDVLVYVERSFLDDEP